MSSQLRVYSVENVSLTGNPSNRIPSMYQKVKGVSILPSSLQKKSINSYETHEYRQSNCLSK